jgi:ribonuclease D
MHGIDIETTALDPAEGRLRLMQLSDGEEVTVYDAFRVPDTVLREALEANGELVAHNAPFERAWIRQKLGVDLPNLHDTMVMSQVL